MDKPKLMQGNWWERLGHVVYLHPAMDPNEPEMMTGWVKVTDQRASEVIREQAARRIKGES